MVIRSLPIYGFNWICLASVADVNRGYFFEMKDPNTGQTILEVNFDGYYKGSTLDRDLKTFKF